jgi:hypothetical protein
VSSGRSGFVRCRRRKQSRTAPPVHPGA